MGQPARLEEAQIYLQKQPPTPANQMAGPRTHCSPCRNPPPAGKDKLTGGAPTKGSGTNTLMPAVSHAPTPAPALDVIAAPAPAPTDELFK